MSRATFTLAPKPFEIEVHGALKRGLPATLTDPGEPPSATITEVYLDGLNEEDTLIAILDVICPNWHAEAERELLEQAPTAEDVADDKYDEMKAEGKL